TLAGVRPDAPQGLAVPGLTSQAPVLGPQRVEFCPRDQDHVVGVSGHVNSSPSRGASVTDSTHHEPPDLPARTLVRSAQRLPARLPRSWPGPADRQWHWVTDAG